MATSHRVHMGPMAAEIRDKMGESPNLDQCWNLIRERVGQLLFGQAYATVPFITAADYFHQLAVFVKKRKMLDAILRRPPIYSIIGNLDNMLDRSRSTWYPQFDFSAWDIADGASMYSDYRFRITSAPSSEVYKMMEVVIKKPRIRSVQLPESDTIVINMDNVEVHWKSVRNVYIISEVVLASYVHFLVRIREQHRMVKFDRDIPIAFRYRKFQIAADGTILREVETEMRFNDSEARWIRPTILPVPRPSGADRDKAERKNRTVLTVASQDTDGRPRNDNLQVNAGVVRAVQVPSGENAAMALRRPQPGARIRYIYRPRRLNIRSVMVLPNPVIVNSLRRLPSDNGVIEEDDSDDSLPHEETNSVES